MCTKAIFFYVNILGLIYGVDGLIDGMKGHETQGRYHWYVRYAWVCPWKPDRAPYSTFMSERKRLRLWWFLYGYEPAHTNICELQLHEIQFEKYIQTFISHRNYKWSLKRNEIYNIYDDLYQYENIYVYLYVYMYVCMHACMLNIYVYIAKI